MQRIDHPKLLAGMKLTARHNGRQIVAEVQWDNKSIRIIEGPTFVQGRWFKSMNEAVNAIRGKKMNAWVFWSVKPLIVAAPAPVEAPQPEAPQPVTHFQRGIKLAKGMKLYADNAGTPIRARVGQNWDIVIEAGYPAIIGLRFASLDAASIRIRGFAGDDFWTIVAPAPVARVAPENPRTIDEWKLFIDVKGLMKLGAGVSRTAYALDNERVIKIQHNGDWHGRDQCASEVARWENSTEEQRQFLAAILDHGDGWTIMERAQCTLREFGGNTHLVEADLTSTTGINDLHAANIGYFGKGRFKILDYAL